MHAFKRILLTGTAVLALGACSSDGPGEIGSLDDIVVRNAGDKAAPPPPSAEPIKEVKMSEPLEQATQDAVEAADATGTENGPSAAEVIAAPDTAAETAAGEAQAQEQAMKDQANEQMAQAAAPAVEQAPDIAWNHAQRVEPQTAPAANVEAHVDSDAHMPSEPPIEDQQAAEQPMSAQEPTLLEQAEAYKAPAVEPAPMAATPAQDAAPAAPQAETMQLTRVEGPVPFDPMILQSKDPAKIKALQKALKDDGYYNGPLNGEMTSDTLNAYVKYQTAANKNVGMQPAAPAPTPTPVPAPVMEQAAEQPMEPAPSERPVMVSRAAPKPLPATNADVASSASAPTASASSFTAANVSMNDPAVISAAQQALTAAGFYNGPVTGKIDTMLLNALSQYQSSKGLTPGGLNLDTLKSLGVVTQ